MTETFKIIMVAALTSALVALVKLPTPAAASNIGDVETVIVNGAYSIDNNNEIRALIHDGYNIVAVTPFSFVGSKRNDPLASQVPFNDYYADRIVVVLQR